MSDEDEDLIGEVPDDDEGFSIRDFLATARGLPHFVREQVVRELLPDADDRFRTLLPEYEKDRARMVANEFLKISARREAEEMYRSDQGDCAEPPRLITLADLLAEPDDPVRYRVDRLWPAEGRVVLAAANKIGKTTFGGNLIRSLVDGEPFLDEYLVKQADRVVLLDNEMSESQLKVWLRDQEVTNAENVTLSALKGGLSAFNILDPGVRTEWAQRIGSADVLIFDCLRPALDALGLSEDKDAGRFLVAMDELCREAGIGELVIVHHMGHSNERSRGDSRIEDWPDAKWKLVREDPDDPNSPRYFSAYGRDVDEPEQRLAYDPANRHLSLGGGSRRETKASRVEEDVLTFVTANPACSQTAVENGLGGNRQAIRDAIRRLHEAGDIEKRRVGRGFALTVIELE